MNKETTTATKCCSSADFNIPDVLEGSGAVWWRHSCAATTSSMWDSLTSCSLFEFVYTSRRVHLRTMDAPVLLWRSDGLGFDFAWKSGPWCVCILNELASGASRAVESGCPCSSQMSDGRGAAVAAPQQDARPESAPSDGEAAAEEQTLSKRQRKKLLKHQKWEEERELRK